MAHSLVLFDMGEDRHFVRTVRAVFGSKYSGVPKVGDIVKFTKENSSKLKASLTKMNVINIFDDGAVTQASKAKKNELVEKNVGLKGQVDEQKVTIAQLKAEVEQAKAVRLDF